MSVIRVGKKPEDLPELEFLREAIREMQEKQKAKGEKFNFDIVARAEKLKQKASAKG